MLECKDGSYYTGYTNDLEKRVKEHNNKRGAKCLRGKLPVKLIWCKEYGYFKNALRAEIKVKRLRRKQKEDLVKIYAKSIS